MDWLRSGHHPDHKYCLHKIGRGVDANCRKCGVGEETAEQVVHDSPRINQPQHEATPSNALAKDSKKALIIWDKWNSVPDLNELSIGCHPPCRQRSSCGVKRMKQYASINCRFI